MRPVLVARELVPKTTNRKRTGVQFSVFSTHPKSSHQSMPRLPKTINDKVMRMTIDDSFAVDSWTKWRARILDLALK